MLPQNAKTIASLLRKPAETHTEEESKLIADWIVSFEFFQPFKDEPELPRLISLLEVVKLQTIQTMVHEDGVELCYVVSGYIFLDPEPHSNESIKKRNKKEAMVPKDWVIRPHMSKACYIAARDPTTEIIIITSKKGRKFINKKLTSKWGELARIIQRQPLFKYLDKDTLLDIAQTAKINTHYYNGVIYSEGDEALYSYILLQGSIKILSGNTQVTILSPEQIFGDEEILGGKTHREFKAICASQKVKLLRVQKSQIEKSLAVLTVLGKQRSVQKYVSSKNEYRKAISNNIRRLLESGKEKPFSFKDTTKDSLPLYKYKKNSIDEYSMHINDDPQAKLISSRFMQTLKLNKRKNSVINSRDVSHSPSEDLMSQRRSLDPKGKDRKVEQHKLAYLPKI